MTETTYAGLAGRAAFITGGASGIGGPDRIRVNAIAPGMVIPERQRRLCDATHRVQGLGASRRPNAICTVTSPSRRDRRPNEPAA